MRARYVRVVEYDVPDREGSGAHELFALITNVLDPANVDARALAGLCVWRWEHELGNKQIKTYLRGPGKILRSRSPDLVYQEIWGYLLTHFTIAALICQGATAAGIDPDKVRYTRTMRIVRRRVGDPSCSPNHQARALARVHADITRLEKLSERRERGYPRVVRRARHNHYKVKSPGQHRIRYDAPATIRVARTSGPAPRQRERTRTRHRPATAVRRVR